jgi:hypothetical protein
VFFAFFASSLTRSCSKDYLKLPVLPRHRIERTLTDKTLGIVTRVDDKPKKVPMVRRFSRTHSDAEKKSKEAKEAREKVEDKKKKNKE